MTLGLVLMTDGAAAAEIATGFGAACGALRPGDRLIVIDSGSDPELTAAIDAVAHPEALPAEAQLTVLRLAAVPPATWGAMGNVGLAEAGDVDVLLLVGPGDPVEAGALASARDRMAESGAEVFLSGGDPPPRPEFLSDRTSPDRLDWILGQPHAPALVRRPWLRDQGLRLPEGGPFPDWRWLWQIAAQAERIGWQAAPLGRPRLPAPLPRDADMLLGLHQLLCAGLPAGLEVSAHGWLIGAMAELPATLSADARWPIAQRLAERLATCPDPIWRQVMDRQGHRRAAVEADALRRGQLLEVIGSWTQTATEIRLARLETLTESLDQARAELLALRRGLDSLCRIAEFDALSALWPTADAAADADRAPDDPRT